MEYSTNRQEMLAGGKRQCHVSLDGREVGKGRI